MSRRKAKAAFAWIFGLILLVVLFSSAVQAAGNVAEPNQNRSVSEALKNGASNDADSAEGGSVPSADAANLPGSHFSSGWTLLLQVIFSLGLVILLIYLLLRFLSKRSFAGWNQSGPIKVISAAQLGNGKSVQIVMIGDSLYILGVGEEVQLLRHIPAGEEMDLLLADAEIKAANGMFGNWISMLRGKREQEELSVQQNMAGTFEELLEKQWSEVNDVETAKERWREEDAYGKGDRR
jgi:flagellar protein FliO/FliZ